jgi:phosphoribosylanthranilate isomerase
MNGPRVKICGITRLGDALAAAEAGADMLGFNFYERSPRYIAPPECARIVAGLRDRGLATCAVGVFVNAPPGVVLATLESCDLDLAQLHGDEPPEMLSELDGRAFKAIRPQTLAEAEAEARRYTRDEAGAIRGHRPALLLDAARAGQYGGTGATANWSLASGLAASYPILLAGGLRPENVAEALRTVRPWGVDVASGVELAPGRKDHRAVAQFVAAVRDQPFEQAGR